MEASRLKLTTPRSVVHGSRLNNNRNKYNSDNNNDHDDDDSINIKRQGPLCCRSTAPWGSAGGPRTQDQEQEQEFKLKA